MADWLILASASPRRRALLGRLGLDPVVMAADIDESVLPGETPIGYVTRLAEAKAAAIAPHADGALVIAADTVVVHADRIIGKPADRDDATRTLHELSGNWHEVITGVVVRLDERVEVLSVSTAVRFRPLSDDEISWYVASGEPDDKAGAYGIQGAGGALISEIRGSESNVVGLPLAETVELARVLGVELLR